MRLCSNTNHGIYKIVRGEGKFFRGEELFCGFEDLNHINLGLGFGAVKGHPYLKEMMNYYETLKFVNEDGSLNLTACHSYQTIL